MTSWVFSTLFHHRKLVLLCLSPRLWVEPKPTVQVAPPEAIQEAPPTETPPEAIQETPQPEEKYPPFPTITHTWMCEQVQKNKLDVQVAKKIQRLFPTFPFDALLSDVRELMFLWAKRGTCDQHIEKGKPPTPSVLAVWAHQKVRQRAYGLATDACARTERGLLTQAEVRARRGGKRNYLLGRDNTAPNKVVHLKDDSGKVTFDLVAPPPEEPLYAVEKFDLAESLLKVDHPKTSEKAILMAGYLRKGKPATEVAALEGCSVLHVRHLFQSVKATFQEAPTILSLSLSLLNSIGEEPFSTVEDLQQEIPGKEKGDIVKALSFLKERGLIQEKGKGSFLQTVKGKDSILLGEIL